MSKPTKTMYDWHPEKRGWLLVPEGSGSESVQQSVYVSSDDSALFVLYRQHRLQGKALIDAQERFG